MRIPVKMIFGACFKDFTKYSQSRHDPVTKVLYTPFKNIEGGKK
jgi:hypothetical protein